MTKARDYGIVQLRHVRWRTVKAAGDLYNDPDVITTGVLDFPPRLLKAGNHKLSVEIVAMNPRAVKAYMFGLTM
ncbi:MAG: hypothetical protein R3C99_21615 [Pirellulaceae bacterium]